jgi:AraC-like DNA-binding protein
MRTPRHVVGGYREFEPPPALRPFVESVWIHRSPLHLASGEGGMHRVLPDPALNLAFSCLRGPDGIPTAPRMIIIGPKTRPHLFPFRPRHEFVAIRVKLEWAAPLLGLVPDDHCDAEHDLAGVLPALATALLEPLADAADPDTALERLTVAAAQRAARIPERFTAAARALDVVRQTSGRMTVDRIADGMGVALRTLRRQVRRDAGVSLKAYARITRFVGAVTLADRSDRPAWAAIAADSGYCDQSHLVRESRAIAGLVPGQVYRERRAQAETSNPMPSPMP